MCSSIVYHFLHTVDNSLKSFKKYFNCAKQEEGNKKKSVKKRKLDEDESLLDTVGAVCLDRDGNICSGVSSGGLLLKYPGRVGQVLIFFKCYLFSAFLLNCIVVSFGKIAFLWWYIRVFFLPLGCGLWCWMLGFQSYKELSCWHCMLLFR